VREKHVHVYERVGYSNVARCTTCSHREKLENLVYLGDAPPSVGRGNRSGWLSTR
jgi:hypothetical protein